MSDVGEIMGTGKPPKKDWNNPTDREMHILLPATESNVHMCKTLLTMTILGYPNPTIVAWGDSSDEGALIGGGSHYAKINRVLEYLNNEERRKRPEFEDELVFMLDSYDIWFQLPVHNLLDRYETIVAEENKRVKHRMGKAYDREGISSQIVFGGGKRCAPNQYQTIGCYTIPESPIPYDIRGSNTDTAMGRTFWSSFRTRYLNSGYMIGPVHQVRPLLERAKQKLDECIGRTGADFDNGNGSTDHCYRGSDQSIFVEIWGEQEFHREVMRRHHRSSMDAVLDSIVSNRAGSKPPKTHVQNTPVDDLLNPDFSHEYHDPTYLEGKPFEFGITIDYWSTLGHQTMHSENDWRYINHDRPLEDQIGEVHMFDCPGKAPMPKDLPGGTLELLGEQEPNRWETVPLYTEMCLGTVPVMLHHNSLDKGQREAQWDRPWWHGRSRALLEKRREQGAPQLTDGIPIEGQGNKKWEELCPSDVEGELFRDQ